MKGHRWAASELGHMDKLYGEDRKRWVCMVCSAEILHRPDRVPGTLKKVMAVISSHEVEEYSCEEYLIWSMHKA